MNVPIKVALIGATGKVGKPLLKQLLDQGYQVKSLIRKPQSYSITHPSMEIVAGDIKDLETVTELVKGCDAVISVIGQLKDEPLISSLAASNLIHAMNKEQISRYIFLTGLTLDMPGDQKSAANQQGSAWMKQTFPVVVADKEKAVELLQQSNIDWTIVRLPWIEETEEKKQLVVDLQDCLGEKVSTAGLAAFLIEQLSDPRFIRKAPFVASI
ncbi:Putative NADH-flavin reductase [Pedobacter steynii]|uniref:Putative NADH-flavin reductase n=1 Tax=Pedobacter steynii TaxID=430522 RepID=A0A1H0B4I8_9SPHI|nr:NAD(P)H-binding protein [Pedobacter steynii]NQX41161.1 NAD(P)H-binding protein [Pedobacter steynii]SDN40580.1 Putative NADH-flavin reductase [Pedobacter steynii]